jgi:oligoribonuclease NrnB/cAMP/cGMP phosphodiesterase (DHH superfamily)
MYTTLIGTDTASEAEILHISHDDLDGIGSNILMKAYAELEQRKMHQYMISYSEMKDLNFDEMITDNIKYVFITDLSFSETQLKPIIERYSSITFIVFDHHESSKWIAALDAANCDSIIDMTQCGTKLVYNWLLENIDSSQGEYHIDEYSQFVDYVNDYDMWIHQYPEATQLNILKSIFSNKEFIDAFSLPCISSKDSFFDNFEMDFIEAGTRIQNMHVNNAVKGSRIIKSDKFTAVITFANAYTSEIGSKILDINPSAHIVLIVDIPKGSVSLRARDEFDCAAAAKRYGGGGHKNAAGFSLPNAWCNDAFMSIFPNDLI